MSLKKQSEYCSTYSIIGDLLSYGVLQENSISVSPMILSKKQLCRGGSGGGSKVHISTASYVTSTASGNLGKDNASRDR